MEVSTGNHLLSKKYYFYIFFLAVCFRLILLLTFEWEDHIIDSYDDIAVNMLEGNGFSYNGDDPTVCRAPAYPTYLATIFYCFGYHPVPFFILRLIDITLDSITAIVVLWLSILWFPNLNRFGKLGAGIAYALNPFAAYYTLKLGAEPLSIFFFSIHLVILYKVFFQKKLNFAGITLLGISGGILMLNKSIFLPVVILIPILLFSLFLNMRSWSFVLSALLATGISFLILLPWSWRNTAVADRFIPVQTLLGFNFWYDFTIDNNRNLNFVAGKLNTTIFETGKVLLNDGSPYYPYSLDAKQDAKYDRELINRAIKWIKNNPSKFAIKVIDNMFSFWYMVKTPKKMIIAAIFSLTFICLSLRGAVINFSLGHKLESIFFLVLILSIDLVYAPVFSIFRFSLATFPVLSLLAGSALHFHCGLIFCRKDSVT